MASENIELKIKVENLEEIKSFFSSLSAIVTDSNECDENKIIEIKELMDNFPTISETELYCVVSELAYQGNIVEGIYTTFEKAEEVEKLMNDNKDMIGFPDHIGWDRIDIYELEVDAIPKCIQDLIDKGKKVR